jgi:hypothetical protein
MSALKSILGGVSGVFSKPKATKATAKTAIKAASTGNIKTTPKFLGNMAPAVSGGQVVKESATQFMKGAGTTANVGGRVFAGSVILGGATLGAAKIYDYVGDTWAVTTSQREYENQIKLAGKEAAVIKEVQDNNLSYMEKLADLRNKGIDSSALTSSGGVGDSTLFPIQRSIAEAEGSDYSWVLAGLGLAAVGTGIYFIAKKKRSK